MNSLTLAQALELPRDEIRSSKPHWRIDGFDRPRHEKAMRQWMSEGNRGDAFPDPRALDDLALLLTVREESIKLRFTIAELDGLDDDRLREYSSGDVDGIDRTPLEIAYDGWISELDEEERETVVSPAAALDDLSLYTAIRLVGIAPTSATPAIG